MGREGGEENRLREGGHVAKGKGKRQTDVGRGRERRQAKGKTSMKERRRGMEKRS